MGITLAGRYRCPDCDSRVVLFWPDRAATKNMKSSEVPSVSSSRDRARCVQRDFVLYVDIRAGQPILDRQNPTMPIYRENAPIVPILHSNTPTAFLLQVMGIENVVRCGFTSRPCYLRTLTVKEFGRLTRSTTHAELMKRASEIFHVLLTACSVTDGCLS